MLKGSVYMVNYYCVHFEHHIRLKDPSMPPSRSKIHPLDQTGLAELKKQIVELLKENKIWVSENPYGSPILFAKKKDG